MIDAVFRKWRPPIQVVMGLSGNNMVATLQMQQAIQLRDIAGVLIPAPYYIRPSQCGLIDYFTWPDASNRAVILYNIPQRTGIAMGWPRCAACTPPAHRRHQGLRQPRHHGADRRRRIDVMTGKTI